MGATAMPKTNLKTQAYNTIRQKIVTCEYAPGTFLNEELLTSELGLSPGCIKPSGTGRAHRDQTQKRHYRNASFY